MYVNHVGIIMEKKLWKLINEQTDHNQWSVFLFAKIVHISCIVRLTR